MFKNYLKVALRNIRKQKGYAFLNISGLAIGMAVCLMILLWVRGELSYDTFHAEAENIYRVGIDANLGSPMKAPVTMPAAAPTLIRDLPEVLKAARIIRPRRTSVTFEEKEFFEEGVGFADNSFFEIFSFPFVSGDPSRALEAPNTAVITETTARKYFGAEDPIGRTIKIGGDRPFAITGVVKDIPANSHLSFTILRSMQTQLVDNPQFESNWFNINLFTYILLDPNSDAADLEKKLVPFSDKYMGPTLKALGGSLIFFLQPLKHIHLHSDFPGDISAQGDIRYVYIFSGIAFFVLLIACINFINLATARSASRAREVGMRKVLGAVKRSLAAQFLGESVFLSLISLVRPQKEPNHRLPVVNSLALERDGLSQILQHAVYPIPSHCLCQLHLGPSASEVRGMIIRNKIQQLVGLLDVRTPASGLIGLRPQQLTQVL